MLVPGALLMVSAIGALTGAPVPRDNPGGTIVFSVRTWDGEFSTRNVTGRGNAASPGLEITSVRSKLSIIKADGTDRREVPLPMDRADNPVSSPDGRWIYFQTETRGDGRIYRCRPDGSALAQLAPVPELGPAWHSVYGTMVSPDGAYLTYTVTDGKIGRSVIARADGSEPRVLAPSEGYIYMASPGPGGEWVVASGPAHGYRLLLLNPATGGLRMLTPDDPDSYTPQFTPDGRTVVFIRRDGGLYRIGAEGTGLRRIATGLVVRFRLSPQDQHGSTDVPSISPDGRSIAFAAHDEGSAVASVHRIDVDGGNPRRLTRLPGECGRVRWSRDGKWLAFVSFVGDKPQLFVVSADGGEAPRQLTAGDGAVYTLSWRP